MLRVSAKDDPATHLVDFDIAMRRRKYLQALRALNHAHKLLSDDAEESKSAYPDYVRRVLPFAHAVETKTMRHAPWSRETAELVCSPAVYEVLSAGVTKLLGGASVQQGIADAKAKCVTVEDHLGVAEAILTIDPASSEVWDNLTEAGLSRTRLLIRALVCSRQWFDTMLRKGLS